MNRAAVEDAVRRLLRALLDGEESAREEELAELLAETPRRVANAMAEDLLAGYRDDPRAILQPMAARPEDGPVLLAGVRFTAMCAHHLLPFRGVAHVGFTPAGRRVGLGGVARLVDVLARRLTLQETLTAAIADEVERALAPRAVLVAVEAEHLCLSVRGARKTGHRFRTVERRGSADPSLEALFFGWPEPS